MLAPAPRREALAPELAMPGLMDGRCVVGEWLIPELAGRLGVEWTEVAQAFASLPSNYNNLLDSAEGVNLLAAVTADLLGVPSDKPFFSRQQ